LLANRPIAVTRNSQPSGFCGWRRATTTPTAAQGMPMTTATIPLPSWPESSDSGSVATRDSTASPASTAAQTAGEATGQRRSALCRDIGPRAGRGSSTMGRLRLRRSENVTAPPPRHPMRSSFLASAQVNTASAGTGASPGHRVTPALLAQPMIVTFYRFFAVESDNH
jgi:hypothetical protein